MVATSPRTGMIIPARWVCPHPPEWTRKKGFLGATPQVPDPGVNFPAPEEGSPTNVRCKAPHLIKIILAYSPKKERADPIEDESEVQQGHFCPPPFSRSRTWTLPLIQLPASKQLASLYKEWKCGPPYPATSAPCDLLKDHYEPSPIILFRKKFMVDQDENESGNPGHTHPGAYALLWGGGFIERGKSRVASRLTDLSESEEDLSSDHPEHEGAALDGGIAQGLKSSIQILSFFRNSWVPGITWTISTLCCLLDLCSECLVEHAECAGEEGSSNAQLDLDFTLRPPGPTAEEIERELSSFLSSFGNKGVTSSVLQNTKIKLQLDVASPAKLLKIRELMRDLQSRPVPAFQARDALLKALAQWERDQTRDP
ncbi:hypothetical protein E3N88_46116 [Mikania micrantha]|uniref:Uncharacterized protein n=1 Tax=Mikania micrantha TaxID=192012 RepID=A0A5N6L780_9ASTR|nr:hypothetical protein E3N88_46116 [Mikania micrantha]